MPVLCIFDLRLDCECICRWKGHFHLRGIAQEADNDHEVQVVLAHELAHSAMSHVAKSGGIGLIGSVLEALVFDADDDADGLISDLALRAFSPGFELEADYVGIYMIARAGLDTENVSSFWRRLAVEYPEQNQRTLLGIHRLHTERFVSMETVHREIVDKLRFGSPLTPGRKQRTKSLVCNDLFSRLCVLGYPFDP
ncbi:MAG: M48 family metalloprotease [Gammaproteobacteria bacterium]|nr:M48 family metalloprotease [Gammaproteobacteria bacterium]MYD80965.1 M48 family metalloprotease [Gammaproteobacteria bacterium]